MNLQGLFILGNYMMLKGSALKGGMPLYKYVGNKILTNFQNLLLSTNLSDYLENDLKKKMVIFCFMQLV